MIYRIHSNKGSLSADGARQSRDPHTELVNADSEEEARKKFVSNMTNQMYGRRIRRIEVVDENHYDDFAG